MKLFIKSEEIDWGLVKTSTQKLIELDFFLRLNDEGKVLRTEALDIIKQIFRPLIFGIANTPREFKVYSRPVQEILEDKLLSCLKIAIKRNVNLSVDWIQAQLIESLDDQNLNENPRPDLETSDPGSFSDETWRLIHLENGLFEVSEIQRFLKRVSNSGKLSAAQETLAAFDIEAGQFAGEFLSRNDGISRRERRELETLILNGQRSFELLFESSLSQLLSFAIHYKGRGLTVLELIQEGSLGLIRAIQKFDCEKGFRFATYATWWIRQAMTRAIADSNSLIRVPVHKYVELRKVIEIYESLGIEDFGQTVESWELGLILEELEIDESYLKELLNSIWKIESLDSYLDSEGELTEDGIMLNGFDLSANDPFDIYEVSEFETHMEIVLNSITERESQIIQLRYGFDGYLRTLQEIGEVFDLTRERIRQIESKAMSKLRHPSRSEVLKDYLDIEIWPEIFQTNFVKSSSFLLPKEKQD